MTRVFAVDGNNDIFTRGGQLVLSEGQAAVLQQCEHAIKAQLNEMIYADDRGVNTFDSVWSGSPNLLSFEAFARAQIDRIPDVISIESFAAQLTGNTLTYQATIRTIFGTGTIQGATDGGL